MNREAIHFLHLNRRKRPSDTDCGCNVFPLLHLGGNEEARPTRSNRFQSIQGHPGQLSKRFQSSPAHPGLLPQCFQTIPGHPKAAGAILEEQQGALAVVFPSLPVHSATSRPPSESLSQQPGTLMDAPSAPHQQPGRSQTAAAPNCGQPGISQDALDSAHEESSAPHNAPARPAPLSTIPSPALIRKEPTP